MRALSISTGAVFLYCYAIELFKTPAWILNPYCGFLVNIYMSMGWLMIFDVVPVNPGSICIMLQKVYQQYMYHTIRNFCKHNDGFGFAKHANNEEAIAMSKLMSSPRSHGWSCFHRSYLGFWGIIYMEFLSKLNPFQIIALVELAFGRDVPFKLNSWINSALVIKTLAFGCLFVFPIILVFV